MPLVRLPKIFLVLTALLLVIAAPAVSLRGQTKEKAAESPHSESPLRTAWEDTALGLSKDALPIFESGDTTEARYGEALALLLRQPKTTGNVDRAAKLLETIVAQEPDSAIGIAARYYLARVEQMHRSEPDLVAARRHFQALVNEHPASAWAEQAVVKLAMLDLYAPIADADRATRFADYAARVDSLRDPVSQRDLCLLLADTAQRFNYAPALALDFLLKADDLGLARRVEEGNTWVRIGHLAAELDQPEIARRYFEKFLAAFQRDNRRLMIEQNLAALPTAAGEVSP